MSNRNPIKFLLIGLFAIGSSLQSWAQNSPELYRLPSLWGEVPFAFSENNDPLFDKKAWDTKVGNKGFFDFTSRTETYSTKEYSVKGLINWGSPPRHRVYVEKDRDQIRAVAYFDFKDENYNRLHRSFVHSFQGKKTEAITFCYRLSCFTATKSYCQKMAELTGAKNPADLGQRLNACATTTDEAIKLHASISRGEEDKVKKIQEHHMEILKDGGLKEPRSMGKDFSSVANLELTGQFYRTLGDICSKSELADISINVMNEKNQHTSSGK